jgi:hypothetical protein
MSCPYSMFYAPFSAFQISKFHLPPSPVHAFTLQMTVATPVASMGSTMHKVLHGGSQGRPRAQRTQRDRHDGAKGRKSGGSMRGSRTMPPPFFFTKKVNSWGRASFPGLRPFFLIFIVQ